MKTIPKVIKSYNTVEVIAAAVEAFAAAGDTIVRIDSPESKDPVTGEGWLPATVSNKTRVLRLLRTPEFIKPESFGTAQLVIDAINADVTIKLLTNKTVSSFVNDIVKLFENSTMPAFKIGQAVYAPSIYAGLRKKEKVQEKIGAYLYTSKSLGTEGTKVQIEFTLIEKKFIQSISCYAAFGHDEKGNLIQFVTPKEDRCVSGKLSAKIKSSCQNKYHNNAIVNNLNFVKVLEI